MRPGVRVTLAGLALLVQTLPSRAQEPPPRPGPGEPRPFTLPEKERFTLENGLTVTLIPYGSTPKATVRLTLPTGNVHEGPAEVWLADLTADLLQEGTTSRGAEDIASEAAGMGGSLGVSAGSDRTSVGGDVLAEFAPEMIGLVADVIRNPIFPASELDRLKNDRVRQVSVSLQQPGSLAQAAFLERLYPDHPYGRLFPTAEMIRGYSESEIRDFWTRHYGPAGAHLYVSGRFDADAVREAVREAFGSWAGAEPVPPPPARPAEGRSVVFIERPGAPQSTIYLGLPVVHPAHDDYLPLQVTNALLGGSFGSRITQNIREDKGYTYSPQSFVSSRRGTGYWAQVADVTSDATGPALREIFAEIERLRSEAPPDAELDGVRNYMAGLFVLQNSTRAGIVGQLSFLDLHGLTERYLTTYVDRVHAVAPEDVRSITERYLRPDAMLLVVVGDPAVALPQLRALVGEVEVVRPPTALPEPAR